jgi:hypothetical protein
VAQVRGFEGFRQCVLDRAREAVLKRNPTYARTLAQMVQDGIDVDEMLRALQPLLRGDEIREWRPLLEMAERCRDCARAARAAVRLFNAAPPDEYLQASGVTLGEWTHYHFSSWSIEMHALLERVEELVKRTCRTFLRRQDPSWQVTQDFLLTKVAVMRKALEGVRVRHAHGFGYFDAIEEEKLWELHVVAFPDIDVAAWGMAQEVQFRPRWGKLFDKMTAGALAEIDTTFDRLTASLGWDPLPSQTRP